VEYELLKTSASLDLSQPFQPQSEFTTSKTFPRLQLIMLKLNNCACRVQRMVEINFLCVHKKLRSKRVAPVLIREITRRVNQQGIFQAVYTAGVVLPKPVGACRYYHRSLNPKKLIEVKFSHLARNMTLQRTLKLNKLPDMPKCDGFRKLTQGDVDKTHTLLNKVCSCDWFLQCCLNKFSFAVLGDV